MLSAVMTGGSTSTRCSPISRKCPLKSNCFSWENQDHSQIPGSSCFIHEPVADGPSTRLWTVSLSNRYWLMGYGAEPFVLLLSRRMSLVNLHAFYSVATASFTTLFTL